MNSGMKTLTIVIALTAAFTACSGVGSNHSFIYGTFVQEGTDKRFGHAITFNQDGTLVWHKLGLINAGDPRADEKGTYSWTSDNEIEIIVGGKGIPKNVTNPKPGQITFDDPPAFAVGERTFYDEQ